MLANFSGVEFIKTGSKYKKQEEKNLGQLIEKI